MARRLFLYTGCKHNRGPVIANSKYLYRPSRCKDTGYKYNRGLAVSSKYL